MDAYTKAMLETLPMPLAICDGDHGSTMEQYFEDFFKSNKIAYDQRYGLYSNKRDLSKYATLAFFTTNSHETLVAEILEFDKSNLKCVIVMGEWAYNICRKECKERGIVLLAYDRFEHKLWEAEEFFKHRGTFKY